MAILHDINVDDYLARAVMIEPLALEEEFIKMPADLAYWNERFAEALRQFLNAKIGRERMYARLHMESRESLMAEARVAADSASALSDKKVKVSVKAPTMGDIESAVESSPEFVASRNAEVEAEVEKVRLYGVIDALRCKRDMLVQLGARARVEMEHDPVILEQARVERLRKEGF